MNALYRGRKPNGEWVEGNYIHKTKHYYNPCDEHYVVEKGEFYSGYYDTYEVIPETVGQWTGLCDKNGKEIYEGDIVQCFRDGLSVVMFKCGCFGLESPNPFVPFTEIYGKCEVLGNIHDNPELQKEV